MAYIEYEVVASGDRVGMVINRPDPLESGMLYRLIIAHPGIGERGDGSDLQLDKLRTNGSWYAMEKRVKENGKFILIEVQPKNNYEHGETIEAYNWAKQNLANNIDWKKVYITGLSLGGGGTQRYISIDPQADQKFAAAAICCPGPNQYFILEANYINIANTKMPLWFFHCADDTTVTPDQSTNLTIKKIKALNPNVKVARTIYKTGGHTGCWTKAYGNIPAATVSDADDYNDPTGGVLDFFELNEVGKPAVLPPRKSDVQPAPEPVPEPLPAPEPAPEPAPDPNPTPAPTVFFRNFIDTRPAFGITWSDGTTTTWRIPEGATVKQVYTAGDSQANGQYLKIIHSSGQQIFGPKK